MTISSRTPEGLPHKCPICGEIVVTEPSQPLGDSVCPSCGSYLTWLRDRFGTDKIDWTTSIKDLAPDSLDTVEFVMALEEEFDIEIPADAAEKIQTVADAIEWIRKHRPRDL